MKTANPEMGLAVSELLYGSGQEQTSDSNLANPSVKNKIYGYPSLGEPYQAAYGAAQTLKALVGGIDCYIIVVKALQAKYGRQFIKDFNREVHKNG